MEVESGCCSGCSEEVKPDTKLTKTVPKDDNAPSEESKDESQQEERNWIDVSGDGGILKHVITEGKGASPPDGANVYCHYVGTLVSNGEKFDSSRDRQQPFNFKIGRGSVIRGWDIGIASMKKGEKCILRCRSDYAYGESGQGSIPANSDLDFEVELLNFDEYSRVSEYVMKKVLNQGTGSEYETPQDDAVCVVSYKGLNSSGEVFASGDKVSFVLNDDSNFVEGFHEAVGDMHNEEKCEFKIAAPAAFGAEGKKELNIPENEDVVYQIQLHSFVNPKDLYEMSVEEHFEEAQKAKAEGNESFKEGNYERALKKYKRANEILEHDSDFDEKQKEEAKALKSKVNGNMALIYYKQKEYGDCIDKANEVLKEDEKNIKAYVRRGQANMMSGNYQEASKDYKSALEIDPNNASVKKLMKLNKSKVKEYKERQKKLYGNMFGGSKPTKQ